MAGGRLLAAPHQRPTSLCHLHRKEHVPLVLGFAYCTLNLGYFHSNKGLCGASLIQTLIAYTPNDCISIALMSRNTGFPTLILASPLGKKIIFLLVWRQKQLSGNSIPCPCAAVGQDWAALLVGAGADGCTFGNV